MFETISMRIYSLLFLRRNRYLIKFEKGGYCAVYELIPWSVKVYYVVYSDRGICKNGMMTWKEVYEKIILLRLFNWKKRG